MTHNPYSPPTAKSVSVGSDQSMPKTVQYAAALYATSIIIGFVNSIRLGLLLDSVAGLIALAITISVGVGSFLAILSRKNWLRWIVASLIAFGLVLLPWSLSRIDSGVDYAVYLIQAIMQAVAFPQAIFALVPA